MLQRIINMVARRDGGLRHSDGGCMWLLVGLGNPGDKYAATRHNVGFHIIDELARRASAQSWQNKFKGKLVACELSGERCALLKPQTYMNLSGESVLSAMTFYKISPSNIIVVHDDLDLKPGGIRVKEGGGHGGHNGLRDISQKIGKDYFRVRLGVGRPEHQSQVSSYVLSPPEPNEALAIKKAVDVAADASEALIRGTLEEVQRTFNGKSSR